MRTSLLVLFGVLPAIFLAWFAGLLAFVGGEAFFIGREWYGLVMLIWGIAGIFGAVTLLGAALGYSLRALWPGLVVGVLAILPVAFSAITYSSYDAKIFVIPVVLSPLFVAIYLLYELISDRT